jgi:drug/metabolite transporter (DMT)-like permease
MTPNRDILDRIPPTMLVFVAVLLWSLGGLFFKMTSVSGFEANLGRCAFAAVTIALLTKFKALEVDRFTLLSSLFYVGALSFFAVANKMTPAANAIFLQYTAPVYILVFGPFILKEKFRYRDLATVIFCLGGMALFFIDNSPTESYSSESQLIGNVLALLSGVALAGYMMLLRHPKARAKNPSSSVFYGNIFSVIVMIPFVASAPSVWTSQDLFAIAALGILQIGLAYFLFTNGLARGVRSLDASIIGFVEPLLNPVWVFLYNAETPNKFALAGGAVIILTVLVHTILSGTAERRAPGAA